MKLLSVVTNSIFAFAACAFGSPVFTPPLVSAGELQSSIARGGRLYDNWYEEIRERAPTRMHPAYPADRAYSGDPQTSWRCKECHGWDYRGRDGIYGKGDHATGIKGIRGMAGGDLDKIITILKDSTHAYRLLMADADFRDLANFVSEGQVDMNRYIDRATKIFKGHKLTHQGYYQSICVGCHGRDGYKLQTIPPLGDVTRDNPWEVLHKLLNGHPAEKMPALRVLDKQILVGILAYVQALPDGEIISSIVRGGRLYDNWRKEVGEFTLWNSNLDYPPNKRHPAYPITGKFAKNPLANWRCKECHGWDYLGREGIYSRGPHFSGIKGIRSMFGADSASIVSILKDDNHQYSKILSLQDFLALANFVSKGQIDMDKYIDRTSGLAKGDIREQKAHYTTICASCHGLDGTMVITISPLGRIGRHNPWEALHKIINGHPDEAMPALRPLGMETLTNILAYIQTLPAKR